MWVVVARRNVFGRIGASRFSFSRNILESKVWAIATNLGFVLSCAGSGFAFLAVFLRFANLRSRVLRQP